MKMKKMLSALTAAAIAATTFVGVVAHAADAVTYTWDFTDNSFYSADIEKKSNIISDQNETTAIMSNPGVKFSYNDSSVKDVSQSAKLNGSNAQAMQLDVPDGESATLSIQLTSASSNKNGYLKHADGTVVFTTTGYTKGEFTTYTCDLACGNTYYFDTSESGSMFAGKVQLTVTPSETTEPVEPVVSATKVVTAEEATPVGNAGGNPVLYTNQVPTDATDLYVNEYADIFGVDFANITTSKLGYLGDASRGHVEATFTTTADGDCTLNVLASYARGSNLITVTDSEGNVVLDAVSPAQSDKLGTNGQDLHAYSVTIADLAAGTYTLKWHSESYCSDFLALGVTSAAGATEPEEPGETDEPVEPSAKVNVSAVLNNGTGTLLTEDEIANTATVSFGVAADGTRVAADSADAVMVVNGKYHNDHGMTGINVTVAVSGPTKITVGSCTFGSDATVTDAAGNAITVKKASACWSRDTSNIGVAYYNGEATTLTITGGGYVPYVAVEEIDASEIPNEATLTFDASAAAAEGTAPAEITVEIGAEAIIPANRTLYIDGQTLVAWTDGTNTYAPGTAVTVTEDITLTPVFAANTAKLGDADTTVAFDFQQKSGTPVVAFQNNTGFLVYQANIGDAVIDVKMIVDTTTGKLANANWQDWAQVNGGTKFIVPAVEGAVVTMDTIYGDGNYTINGTAYTQAGQTTGQAVMVSGAETVEIVAVDPTGSYWRGFTVTYPKAVEVPKVYTGTITKVDSWSGEGYTGAATALTLTFEVAEDASYNSVTVAMANDETKSDTKKGTTVTGGGVTYGIVVNGIVEAADLVATATLTE